MRGNVLGWLMTPVRGHGEGPAAWAWSALFSDLPFLAGAVNVREAWEGFYFARIRDLPIAVPKSSMEPRQADRKDGDELWWCDASLATTTHIGASGLERR